MIQQYMDEFEDEDISPEVVNPVRCGRCSCIGSNPVPDAYSPWEGYEDAHG